VVKTIDWKDNSVILIDQTKLPDEELYLKISDYRELADAIKKLKIRGAPAIGIAGAFGVCLGANQSRIEKYDAFKKELEVIIQELAATRPTAVNLFWALDRMRAVLKNNRDMPKIKKLLLDEAFRILEGN